MVKSMKSLIGSTPIHDSHITLHVSASRQLSLDDREPRFMLRRFSRPLSRSQASTLDWNARLND
ncbi:MAG: hypothetical protein DME97_04630 [Verrucomicrobia bacterium]|nr:MAG: hypothetical protein DME97_04630 [Verrucomicrobiota bacterium]